MKAMTQGDKPMAGRMLLLAAGASFFALAGVSPAFAAVEAETAYIFNSLSFLLHGALVMWMAAGFAMLEAGLVRTKNSATQCLKNIALYSLAGLMFWLVGYEMLYGGQSAYFGGFGIWGHDDPGLTTDGFVEGSYSSGSDWFFQMVFVATAGSIVSGAVAERVKLWAFLIFSVVLTGLIYPVQGSWSWGGGFLSELGFVDFAGSTIVHSVGGWAALAGVLIIGPRRGKYDAQGRVHPMPGSNLPLATLGTFILWLGWFGFNGGSQLALGSAADVQAIGAVYINTNLAAAAGVVAAMIATQILFKKIDLTMALNGALAGLVAITAEPLSPTPALAVLVGAVGGLLVVFVIPLLDRLRIDDVVGAIPVHLVCGIWGTLAVPLSNADATFAGQLAGVGAVAAFVFTCSFVIWYGLKLVMGVRVDAEAEMIGLDRADLGMEAYPEFGGSQSLHGG